MELARDPSLHRSSLHCMEWPRVPLSKIGEAGVPPDVDKQQHMYDETTREPPTTRINCNDGIETQVPITSSEKKEQEAGSLLTLLTSPTPDREVAERPSASHKVHEGLDSGVEVSDEEKIQTNARSQVPESPIDEIPTKRQSSRFLDRNQLMARLKLKSPPWPNPELSLGTKCNSLGGYECWVAIGPAQELFTRINDAIGDLLDTRVDELEEGEPVAGNILTFGMYMMGSRPSTARPSLIFSCQSENPRKRALKFIRQSGILKEHPKILLAQSSTCPLASGRGYLRLLSFSKIRESSDGWGSSSSKKEIAPRSTSNSGLSTGGAIAVGVSTPFGVIMLILVFYIVKIRRSRFRQKIPPWHEEIRYNTVHSPTPRSQLKLSAPEIGSNKPAFSASTSDQLSRQPKGYFNAQGVFLPHQKYVSEADITDSPLELPTSVMEQVTIMEPQSESTQVRSGQYSFPSSVEFEKDYRYRGIPIILGQRRATIGGFIKSNGEYFGLTIGHILNPAFNAYSACPFGVDFGFDDSEVENELELVDVDITSQGKH